MANQELKAFAENVWTVDRELLLGKLHFGARMTVVRLTNGELFLHSPVKLTDRLKAELQTLGPVRYVVSPNLMHHLYIGDYKPAFPQAEIFALAALAKKRPDLQIDHFLTDKADSRWQSDLDQVLLTGLRSEQFAELVFFHKATRTLLVTDFIFNFPKPRNFSEKIMFALNDMGGAKPSRLMRFMIKDRVAMRQTLDRILRWSPEKILLSHGNVVRENAETVLRDAFRFLN